MAEETYANLPMYSNYMKPRPDVYPVECFSRLICAEKFLVVDRFSQTTTTVMKREVHLVGQCIRSHVHLRFRRQTTKSSDFSRAQLEFVLSYIGQVDVQICSESQSK
jgi:hypothetical protein